MNTEFGKMARFIKTTNNTILMMQEAQVLLTDMSKRMQEAMDDFTEQISLQQKQIRALTGLVRQLMPTASLGTQPVRPEPCSPKPSPELTNTVECPSANDEKVENDSQPDDHDNDEDASSNT